MRERLDKVLARVAAARAKLNEHPNHTRLQRRLDAAEADLAETWELYDSTPGGQEDLQRAIDATDDPDTRDTLTRRLEAAQRLRAEQTEALRRARAGLPGDDDDNHENGDTDVRRTDDPGTPGSVLEAVRMEPGPAGSPADGDRAALDRSEDPGSRSPRLLIDGRTVDPVAAHELPATDRDDFAARGLSAPTLYELAPTDAGVYRAQMLELTRKNPYAASVHVYDEGEYRQMRLLVTDDGKAGVSLKGDEIVSAYAHKDCAHPKAVQSMLRQATDLGGRRLDCFDTVLPDLYADAGFVPVARLRWNDDYAPDGWDYDQFRTFNGGRPDVVFMAYDPDRVGGAYTPGAGDYVDDYDDGTDRAKNYTPR
ncbi:hypothetical protein [Prescottella subtropica]|uniref:hypothetical protein n=1 Tax=Prescottella subtropica TaxID=2545757 RepID=UPI001F4FD86E|nr:hypothetical protein [Prescottella subtropica]